MLQISAILQFIIFVMRSKDCNNRNDIILYSGNEQALNSHGQNIQSNLMALFIISLTKFVDLGIATKRDLFENCTKCQH